MHSRLKNWIRLTYGVMVTQLILVQSFMVRIHIGQQNPAKRRGFLFQIPSTCNEAFRRAFLRILKKWIFELSSAEKAGL